MLGYLVQSVGKDRDGNSILFIGSPAAGDDFNKYFVYKNGVKVYTDKNGVPIEETTPTEVIKSETPKTNFLLFAALGVLAYILLKKR